MCSITGVIGASFLLFNYLNKRGYVRISRAAIVFSTIAGIIFFSLYLGFNSGIYLYLFVSPFLIYILFDFNKIRQIIGIFSLFLASFIVTYLLRNQEIIIGPQIDPTIIQNIYAFNFASSILLCFTLVTILARKNEKYIDDLKSQQEELTEEILLRQDSEIKLKKSLDLRDELLAEVHHRVKNNLAIVSALLGLKINRLENTSCRRALIETQNRILAMSLVHNNLYRNKLLERTNLTGFIDALCAGIEKSTPSAISIKVNKDIEVDDLDLENAIPMALILNELITNAYNHAFIGKTTGHILISVKRNEKGDLQFAVEDDGIGIDKTESNDNQIGMMLVQSLVEQVNGRLTFQNHHGTKVMIEVPVPDSDFLTTS